MVVIISYAVHCVHVTHVIIGNRHCMCTLRLLCLASETYWPAFVVILCSDPGIGVQCCAHIMVSSAVTKGISHCVCMYTKVFHMMLNCQSRSPLFLVSIPKTHSLLVAPSCLSLLSTPVGKIKCH